MKHKLVVLTGAGMSADSGLKTFRDADGLWEGHDVMSVASPQGFAHNPQLVLEFYNERRRQLLQARPNAAHEALVKLQDYFDVTIITQNVDDLHERAGSKNVIHLHGELFKVRCTVDEHLVLDWKSDLNLGDTSVKGYQLRPHIVWFGEAVPLLPMAARLTSEADILMVIGTSLQVYPAASLIDYCHQGIPIYFIDPNPSIESREYQNLKIIADKAANGVPPLVDSLIEEISSERA